MFVLLVTAPVFAEGSWLVVPVFENWENPDAPVEAMLAPLETLLPRSVNNSTAGRIYEQRHSVAPAALTDAQKARAVASVDRALEQLALGQLEASAETLRVVSELEDLERDSLLQDEAVAQKLFNLCIMRSYQLSRLDRSSEADEQLKSCVRSFLVSTDSERTFSPRVPGPPQLQGSFNRLSSELARADTTMVTVSSGNERCRSFVNGLSAGETPLRVRHLRNGPLRVQLFCDKFSRVHRVSLKRGDHALQIDPRFDAAIATSGNLRLRYLSQAQRDQFMADDGLTIRNALGVDHLALLIARLQANRWTIQVHALDPARHVTRLVGELNFSEAAGYDPKQLRDLVRLLVSAHNNDGSSLALASPVALTAPTTPAPDKRLTLATGSATGAATFPIVGIATAAVGLVGLATSWMLFAERRAYRLREWPTTISASDEAAYERRGAWILAAFSVSASALMISSYFWVPETAEVPAYVWIIGGMGLATAAVGVGMALNDEHCGPETVLPLREPCRSVRADSLFGIGVALTTLPIVTLPLSYMLRLATATAVTINVRHDALVLQVTKQL